MVDLKVKLHYPFQQHNIRFILVPVFSQESEACRAIFRTLYLVFMNGFANILNYLFKLLTVVLQGISVRVGRCFNWKKKRIDKFYELGQGVCYWE